ncbi:MAG: FAD-dependent oxidoreductase [Burkholderiales bacterium]
MSAAPDDGVHFPVIVVGAGACGLVAALAARDAGREVLVLERDAAPAGSTALSSGFIPAAGTRWQRAAGVADSPQSMAADIRRKNHDEADRACVDAACEASGPALEWLADAHGIAFELIDGFLYPGHSVRRMHAVPEKTGAALVQRLARACADAGATLVTSATVTDVVAGGDRRVAGVRFARPDGAADSATCDALVLACSGFGGNPDLVRAYIPEIAAAPYFGHAGNRGDALAWGRALGAATRDLSAYQGHGSLATPHGILITWALLMEGGVQVNAAGLRFADETAGYSERCLDVLRQPGGVAWDVYDARLHALGLDFPDYRDAVAAGAVREGTDAGELARRCGLPEQALADTLAETAACARGQAHDRFGRASWGASPLAPPYFAVKVTGALFHTQGGLAIDAQARVIDAAGRPLPNLWAGGGAACGLSGAHADGYLSGNGLLSAVAFGRLAGMGAADGR